MVEEVSENCLPQWWFKFNVKRLTKDKILTKPSKILFVDHLCIFVCGSFEFLVLKINAF